MLAADLDVTIGPLHLDAALRVDDGEVVALLGPNGAGKTTALRTIAGLLALDGGCIVLDGRVLDEPSSRTFVPTAQRHVGFVFQDHLLFPRMTALDNVAFGLRAQGTGRAESATAAHAWLERLGLAAVAGTKPDALSGGQAQRVALARALATEPRLLLLDEPLAALDASTRVQVRTELRRHLATFGGARLLVTHDPVDALVLADRLVIIEDGRIAQQGLPAHVTAHPASRYVAELVGINLLHGDASGERTVRLASGAELTVADPLPGATVAVAIRPQALALHRHRPDGSPRNAWEGVVSDIEADRDRVRVTLSGPVPVTAEVTAAAVADLELVPGAAVWVSVKAVDLTTYLD